MTIPVSKVVKVSILSSPTFPKRKGFGLLLIVGKSARLPVGNRIRFYSDMDAVAADFDSTDEEYKAAQVFFSQAPRPTELAIGRRFDAAVPGELLCSVNYEKTIATWQAINNGAFKINIDGGAVEEVSGIDLSGAANLNAVAAAIQTRLQLVSANATCTFDGTRFIFRSGTTGAASTVDYTTAPGARYRPRPAARLPRRGSGHQDRRRRGRVDRRHAGRPPEHRPVLVRLHLHEGTDDPEPEGCRGVGRSPRQDVRLHDRRQQRAGSGRRR